MATRLSKQLHYDASVDAVAAMLAHPTFREAVLETQRVLRGSVSIEGSQVRIEQVQSAGRIPSFAKKFVGDEITIVQTESWTTPGAAEVRLAIPGKPSDIAGSATLAPGVSGGTVETIDLSIKVAIPLVGGKIEKLIAELFERALDKEHAAGIAWLARS